MRLTHEQFRELAAKHGLAVTHQRQVVYEAVIAAHGHHSPETIYAAVRRRIPSISLATVSNIRRLFTGWGCCERSVLMRPRCAWTAISNLITTWSAPAANP